MTKNKYKSLLIIILILTLFSLQIISAKNLPLIDTIITVDPGHGGRDSGTTYNKILEKDINLEIAKALDNELTKNGAITYMTRTQDVDLSSIYDARKKRGDLYRRLLFIKEKNSALYLSVHINWYKNENYQGAEVLYNPINEDNKVLAEYIMKQFKKDLKSNRDIKTTDLYMYKNTTVPGVLIECGYLSNYQERKKLQDPKYQKQIAASITKGVINYLKNKDKVKYIL